MNKDDKEYEVHIALNLHEWICPSRKGGQWHASPPSNQFVHEICTICRRVRYTRNPEGIVPASGVKYMREALRIIQENQTL